MIRYWSYGSQAGYGFGSGFSILSFILTILFWWLVIMLIVKIFHIGGSHHSETGPQAEPDNSLKIAKERYAKGEIDKKAFEQLKKDLG